MKCEVTLYNSGKVFKETMYARDYQQARQVALSRNPGSTHVSTTAVFEPDDANCSFDSSSSSSSYSTSSNNNSSSSSGGSSIGLGGLIILAGLVGLVSMFGGGDSDTYEPDTTTQPEQVQPRQSWSTNAPPALDVEAPFFVQDGIQEEVIDDLGQDWDN